MRRYGDFTEAATAPPEPNMYSIFLRVASRGWCWCVRLEEDGRWTLRRKSWVTERLSAPLYKSPPLTDYGAAIEWAGQRIHTYGSEEPEVVQWTWDGIDLAVDAAYQIFRHAKRTADGPRLADAA